ncbi:glycosyltransferase family 2 protein [Actinomadura opuntiae]|uniref:glycosyltransferase family 2 protein n=1 Tax=Actinomadura sp. OS1-43 TaxID=604315 RepID=UPI00255A9039|nr:glycosyltransferase [Actinomadura sp. OS1-43]MDL4813075.1 glycosyltransferase [Actinomadura sp. OS1-43]
MTTLWPPARGEKPLVSVVVSVRGNANALHGLLTALALQSFVGRVSAGLEVVVVNNSRRRRCDVRAVVAGSWPFPVRVFHEPRPGLSRGRNRGIRAARGRYMVLTDADIRPRTGWLQALVAAAGQHDAAVVGGRAVTSYPDGTALTMGWVAARPLAECHGPLEWPERASDYGWPYWIVGANILIDRRAFVRLGLLRTDLGRRGRLPLDCEDLEFADRASQAGLRVMIEPKAVVDHPVGRAQTRPGWFLLQGACHGICVARMRTTVRVPAPAVRAGFSDIVDVLALLAAAWAFLDDVQFVVALRDAARIFTYHLERVRLVFVGRTLLPLSSTDPEGCT